VGIALAALEGADIGRVAAMGVLHDGHETRISDVPSVGRAYITSKPPEVISGDQTAGMPEPVAEVFRDLVAEFEAAETMEAKVARDADKLETLLQAAEYAALGHDTEPWQETSVNALRTESAKKLAEAIMSGSPHGWWRPYAASYPELRAAAQARSRREDPPQRARS
jgi:putative hydrolase of HD superfamily